MKINFIVIKTNDLLPSPIKNHKTEVVNLKHNTLIQETEYE